MNSDAHFTLFIRLPFDRGDFIDPPSINWSSEKDGELWNLLSRASSKGRDLDWHALADRFDVSLSFLSQQAAWLYQRQLSQVRAQLRKANKPSLVGTHPVLASEIGSDTVGGSPMVRGGSGGSRMATDLSHRRKEPPISLDGESEDGLRMTKGHSLSRNTSSNTITQLQILSNPQSARSLAEAQSPSSKQRGPSRDSSRKFMKHLPRQSRQSLEKASSPAAFASDSSDSASSIDPKNRRLKPQSCAFTHQSRCSTNKAPLNALSDSDSDEDSPPFLPFSRGRSSPPAQSDPGATVRIASEKTGLHGVISGHATRPESAVAPASHVDHSSSSSAHSQLGAHNRHQIALSALSPRQKRMATSMGSSFSDLDDANITQSALEEALANEMTQGGGASKMSTISQALRSRYL